MSLYIEQDYSVYTQTDHDVWAELCARRIPQLDEQAARAFIDGLDVIGLDTKRVPNLAEINSRLQPKTGWQAAAVPGYVPAREFLTSLAQRKFPTTITVRSWEQLEYLPEPDIFHDVFGHVPTQADQVFGDFMAEYGALIDHVDSEEIVTQLARLYWFTVEFGLIREDGRVKIYGSGLLSSLGEGVHALSDKVEKRPFTLEETINTPFEIDHFQPLLFVIDDFEQLFDAAKAFGKRLVHA